MDIFHESVQDEDLRLKLEQAHHAVTISQYNMRYLRRRFPGSTSRLHLVRNGLELERFPYREPRPLGPTLRVAAVGRLVEKKGFQHLLPAAAELLDQGVKMDLRIAGTGIMAEELEASIDQLRLGEHVRLLGPQTQDQVHELLHSADIFVAPCVVGADGNADGMPTVLLEAMATGVPCVSTSVTGIPEVVRNGSTGVLVRPGNPHALARGIRTLGSARHGPACRVPQCPRRDRGGLRRPPPGRAPEVPLPFGKESRMTRVAYLCADPGVPVFGTKGSSVHVQEIVRAWRGTGAVVTVYCTRLGTERPSDLADLDVVEVKPESVPGPARERAVQDAALGLADEVLRNGCGLFYERYSLFSPALSVVARILDVPSVLEVNAPLIEEQQRYRQLLDVKKAETVFRRNAATADVVACVSDPVVRWVRARVPTARTVLAPNGVNVDRIPARRPGRRNPDHLTVGFVGTLKPWHGVPGLLHGVALANQQTADPSLRWQRPGGG